MADFTSPAFTRYAAVHQNINGPGDSRPTAEQIIKDDNLEGKLVGKVIFITGCSSGIGIETARALKATGAHIYATARDLTKGQKALAGILEPGKVELLELDLESFASVRSCAAEFLAKSAGKLNILINNAGSMAPPEGRTKDGLETQFGVNHAAHFLLFQLLKNALLSSSTPAFHSRIVNLTSNAHRFSEVRFDNLNLEGEYEATKAYGQSKTANIYMATEIERRYGAQGLHALAAHPGATFENSGIKTHLTPEALEQYKQFPGMAEYLKSPPQGAATSVWAAVAPVWEGKGGKYLEDCQVAGPVEEGYTMVSVGYETWAYDEEKARKLWEVSNELVGFVEE